MSSRVLSRDEVENIIESILEDKKITNPTIQIVGGSIKGDGYMSFLTKVDVKGSNDKELNLMIKVAPQDEEFRKFMPIGEMFLREIYFYDSIINEFKKFQKERGVDVPIIVPKCFKTRTEVGKELLVMENVKLQGFRMWNRNNQMDEVHVDMVFNHYAIYHAVSYALKDQKPELFEEIVGNLYPFFTAEKNSIEIYSIFIENVKKSTSCIDPVAQKEIRDSIDKFVDGLQNYFLTLEKFKNKNSVIIHGDGWCNNMMFKYENDDLRKPTEMLLLDFQVVLLASPMTDLCYFFHSSAQKQILYNYKHHLSIYYNTLKEHYEKLGGSPGNLPTFDELLQEWSFLSKYGFVMAMTLFKTMLCSQEEAIDFNNTEGNFQDLFNKKIKNEDVFEEMVKVLCKYMYDHQLF